MTREYKIVCDLVWTYEDKSLFNQIKIIEDNDAYNAVATLQYVLGDSIKAEIISVDEL